MASGDTKTNQYLDVAANGTRADLPSDTCCETRSQTLIREVAERIMDVEDEVERLENNPDVVDIVATYADLQAYDTSQLTDKDVIRVLQDETHDGDSTYYRWSTETQSWTYIGESKQYTAFVGTDGTSAGTAGLVPAPATTDADKFLKADGTWAEAGGGGGSGIPTNAKFWGQSYDNVNNNVSGNIDLGGGTKSIINDSSISNSGALFLANGAAAIAIKTTALNSAQYRFEEVEAYFSKPLYMAKRNTTVYQQIKNMADPTNAQDAATKNYVDSIYPVGAVLTSTSATAPTIAGGTWTEIGTQTVGSSTVHYYERTA